LLLLVQYGVCLLPGGGTSLYIGSDSAVAVNTNFTELAGATSYSLEFWMLNNSPYTQPPTVMFSSDSDNEYFMISAGEVPSVTLEYQTDFPSIYFGSTWHHVAISACGGVGVSLYVDGELYQLYNWAVPTFEPSVSLNIGKYDIARTVGYTTMVVDDTLGFRGYGTLHHWTALVRFCFDVS
jgi:hypothetical protein